MTARPLDSTLSTRRPSDRALLLPDSTKVPLPILVSPVATALVGIPNRYMHSPVEVVCLDDLERAARLLAEFRLRVTPQIDWTP